MNVCTCVNVKQAAAGKTAVCAVCHNTLLRINEGESDPCLSVCPLSACQEVVYVSAKLRLLEHRQQRISEVRAKYQCLKKELEQTKQHLMLEPHKWTTECK